MGLIGDLGAGPIALDTCVFIYFIERHRRLLPLVEPVFRAVDAGSLLATTSAVTLLETLVVPYRTGDDALARRYEALLTRSLGLELVQLDTSLLRAAALLRARYGVKTPDALQLAAALSRRCTAFLTNDRKLPSLPGLTVLQLSSYLPPDGGAKDRS